MTEALAARRRVLDTVTLALVCGLSLLLLIYVGYGEARRTYEQFHLEKLVAQNRVVQSALESYLRAGLPLKQYAGFGARAARILASDETIASMAVFDADGRTVFATGAATGLLRDAAAEAVIASPEAQVRRSEHLVQVVLPLSNRLRARRQPCDHHAPRGDLRAAAPELRTDDRAGARRVAAVRGVRRGGGAVARPSAAAVRADPLWRDLPRHVGRRGRHAGLALFRGRPGQDPGARQLARPAPHPDLPVPPRHRPDRRPRPGVRRVPPPQPRHRRRGAHGRRRGRDPHRSDHDRRALAERAGRLRVRRRHHPAGQRADDPHGGRAARRRGLPAHRAQREELRRAVPGVGLPRQPVPPARGLGAGQPGRTACPRAGRRASAQAGQAGVLRRDVPRAPELFVPAAVHPRSRRRRRPARRASSRRCSSPTTCASR